MIQFNELRVTSEEDTLVIDISVKDLDYYTNIYLDSINIDTQDTYTKGGPSSKVVYSKTISGNTKSIRLELSNTDLGNQIKDTLFFIYVKTKGTLSSDTSADSNNFTTLGVVWDTYHMYYCSMVYIKQIDCHCNIPKNFIDYILQIKAFTLAIQLEQYISAIEYWNKFFKKN